MSENIDVGEGFRRLQKGEKIEAGDSCFWQGEWEDDIVATIGTAIGDYHVPFRRKQPATVGWVSVKEQPSIGDPKQVWVCDQTNGNHRVLGVAELILMLRKNACTWTHWQPFNVTPPPLPTPEKTEEQKAFEAWLPTCVSKSPIPISEIPEVAAAWQAAWAESRKGNQ